MRALDRTTGHRPLRRPSLAIAAAMPALVLLAACQETEPAPPRATLAASRAVEVGLVASTLAPGTGDTIVVLARLVAGADVRPAASYTLRLSYDATRLAYAGEQTRADGAMRVINGEIPGDVRVAGAATDGFRTGELVALRFVAKGAGGVGTLQLAVDQLHATDGEELARATIRPLVVDAQVAR